MKKVVVDDDLCIGCGACISACPEKFAFNDDGKSVVIEGTCDCDLEEIALDCPVQAITVTEGE